MVQVSASFRRWGSVISWACPLSLGEFMEAGQFVAGRLPSFQGLFARLMSSLPWQGLSSSQKQATSLPRSV